MIVDATRHTATRLRPWWPWGLAFALAACPAPDSEPPAPPEQPKPTELSFEPPALPRLTNLQYRHAVRDLLGQPLPETPLEPDTNPYLFYSIGAATTPLSEFGTQMLEEAAHALTVVVFDHPTRREELVGCTPATTDDACAHRNTHVVSRVRCRHPGCRNSRSPELNLDLTS